MRLQDIFASRKVETKNKKTLKINNKYSVNTLFSTEMHQHEIQINGYDQEIDTLRNEIETAGDKLEKEPTINNFKHFRDILSKLAKRISSEAYCLEKCGVTPQNPRYYEIIITINVEADKLYNLIVQEQKNNMAITANVIGIKGLVVDLIT